MPRTRKKQPDTGIAQLLLDNAADPVCWVDQHGTLRYANAAMSRLLGHAREDLPGMAITDLSPGLAPPDWTEVHGRVAAGDLAYLDCALVTAAGERIAVGISFSYAATGGDGIVCLFIRDTSSEGHAADPLSLLTRAIDDAPDFIYLNDIDGNILYANKAAARSVGHTPGALRRMNVVDIDPAITREQITANMRDARGKPFGRVESVHTRADGTRMPIESVFNVVRIGDFDYSLCMIRDLTDRKRQEQLQSQLQFAVHHAADSLFMGDDSGQVHLVNEAACKALGYSEQELLSMTVFDFVVDLEQEQWAAMVAEARNSRAIQFESVNRRKDGSIFTVQVSLNHGTFEGKSYLCAFVRDITAQKRSLRRLTELQHAIENVGDAVYLFDSNARFYYANKAACQDLGYDLEELTTKTIMDVDPSMDDERWRNRMRELKGESSIKTFESRNFRKDGSSFPVEVTTGIFELDGFEFGCAVNRDLTERKENERHLLFTQNAIDNASDGVFFLDRDGRFLYVNATACRTLGYDRQELLGMDVSDIDPRVRSGELPQHAHVSNFDRFNGVQLETKHLRKDGTTVPVEVNSSLMEFEGEIVICAIVRDITERQRTRLELERYQQELESLVEERTAELRHAQEELVRKERLAVLGQLTGVVGHELRNPLGTIRTSLFLIQQHVPAASPVLARAFERAERNIGRCDRIIEELRDYTRTRPLQPESVVFRAWLEGVLEEFPLPADVKLSIDTDASLQINVEPERFRRCIINVLSNACEAMLVNPPERPKRIGIGTRVTASELIIEIRDTGPGIEPGDMQKVFEPLYSTKGFGVGLGLPIVEQIVRLHGGTIAMDSVVGEGTTVTLSLPLATH